MYNKHILPILIALLSIVAAASAYYASFIIDAIKPSIGITIIILFSSIAISFIGLYIDERMQDKKARNNQSNN